MVPASKGGVHFSKRTGWSREASELETCRVQGNLETPLLDLTISNPTACGFELSAERVLLPLRQEVALDYMPDPKGLASARRSVCLYYAGHGATVDEEQVLLTASTSEAYSHLFRLLCDPGDEVLIAQPSYPLFDYLAEMCDVVVRPYPLFYDHGWWIDSDRLEKSVTARTRALVVVHPNNPTGHAITERERELLEGFCVRHGLALIVDEVFLDYAHKCFPPITSFASGPCEVPTFVLNGLSKIACLPQMKVGWIVVLGPERERMEALARLEIVADTFLSVNTPAQLALPTWLEAAPLLQQEVSARMERNLAILRSAKIDFYPVEAGWSVILRVPRALGHDTGFAALQALGIRTHPLGFYGMDDAWRVVASLIVPSERMEEACRRLRAVH